MRKGWNKVYGIWNGITKRFVFGIREDTKSKALAEFKKKAPGLWRYWRYEVRKIPRNFKNPRNPLYPVKEGR